MSGSESKSERETNGSSPSESDRTSLVDFLAPPRPRSSIPPREEAAASNETATTTQAAEADLPVAKVGSSENTAQAVEATETPPVTSPDAAAARSAGAPPNSAEVETPESRRSQAPSVDVAARSLIPVATSTTLDDARDAELDGEFGVPGAGPPWSSASVRRMTYVALLAAAAAVPAWVVFRARTVDVQARADNAAPKAASAAAGPSTLQPTREIEGDDEEDTAEPEPPPVAVDPAKALEARREARRLLEAGNIEPGVAAARNAIALNPADPEAYVLLAAGLQDMGRWAESREVFSRCVHKSKDGINAECAYFATSGTITNR